MAVPFMPAAQVSIVDFIGKDKEARIGLWGQDHKRIFFMTPQILYNDINLGMRRPAGISNALPPASLPCSSGCALPHRHLSTSIDVKVESKGLRMAPRSFLSFNCRADSIAADR
jgi:hypothetical protein